MPADRRSATLDTEDLDPVEAQPADDTFWKDYNSSYEFPTSIISSVLTHALIVLALVLIVFAAMGGRNSDAVPIRLVEGGWDDTGEGSAGSGGENDPLAKGESAPTPKDFATLPNNLPEVQQDVKKQILDIDPSAVGSIPDEKAAAYAALDKALRDKLLGERRGSGPGAGSGNTGQTGTGPGGVGADSTRARSLRWILRFRTRDGRDYLDQLKALGATVMVPVPPENKQMYLFRDLTNPKPGTIATDADIAVLARQIQFSDFRRESVEGIGRALNLNYTPSVFWAFFPTDLEQQLSRLEVAYRNRRPEDIEETIFMVTVRNGEPALVVVEQRAKR